MTFPANNLPTASRTWAREVEKKVTNLESSFRSAEVNNVTRDSQLSVTANAALNAATQAQAAAAQAQQATEDLQDVVNNIYVPGTENINGAAVATNTINGSKVVDGSLPAGKIQVNSITADQINTNYVYAGQINAGQINAGTVNGLSITGGSLNTTAVGGKSVSISGSSASFQYNGSGVGSVEADTAGRLGVFANSGVYITGGSAGVGVFQGNFSCEFDAILNGGLRLGGVSGSLFSRNSDGQMEGPGFRATGNMNVAGDLFVSMDSGSGTTVVVDGNNKFLRSSSSQRYKQQVEEMQLDAGITSMPLKTFKYNYDVETYGEDAPKLYGYIAEELDAEGFTDFVVYETLEDGTKRPDAVRYDSIFAALHKTVQHQAELIEALEARLSALESR